MTKNVSHVIDSTQLIILGVKNIIVALNVKYLSFSLSLINNWSIALSKANTVYTYENAYLRGKKNTWIVVYAKALDKIIFLDVFGLSANIKQ